MSGTTSISNTRLRSDSLLSPDSDVWDELMTDGGARNSPITCSDDAGGIPDRMVRMVFAMKVKTNEEQSPDPEMSNRIQ